MKHYPTLNFFRWSGAILFSVSFVWAAEEPTPHRKGKYTVRFTERDPRSDISEALQRLRSTNLKAARCLLDLSKETYEVYVPRDYDGTEPYGLFVWIHASNDGFIPRSYEPLMDKYRLVAVGANNSGNGRDPHWIRSMLAIDGVYNMKRLYHIDEDRIYVSGISGGGRMSSMVAVTYPDVFTGGGYYIIGCNTMKPVPAGGNKVYPGFWHHPVRKLLDQAKIRRYAMITGSSDWNKPGTQRVYSEYRQLGFEHVTYLEQPGLGHQLPSAGWYEKGLIALDKPLYEGAIKYFAEAQVAETRDDLLTAYRNYFQSLKHGRRQSFYDQAQGKVKALEPKVAELSQTAFDQIAANIKAEDLRKFAVDWRYFPGGEKAAEKANTIAEVELEEMKKRSASSRRSKLKKFLKEWADYPVCIEARAILETDAQAELDSIMKIRDARQRALKLRTFESMWAPAKATGKARIERDKATMELLTMIKTIYNRDQQLRMLIDLIDIHPNTQAHEEAFKILQNKYGR